MLSLVRNLCLIIGHSVPQDTDCYNLLKMLKSIVEIVVSPVIHVLTPSHLNTLITEYLCLHNELFPKN